jgi:hypothetical protein
MAAVDTQWCTYSMRCSNGHPTLPRDRIIPGLYRCRSVTTIFPMQLVGPYGEVRPLPVDVPCDAQQYYDDSTEEIALCSACGARAYIACSRCAHYRCLGCQAPGAVICTACPDLAAQAHARAVHVVGARGRQLAATEQTLEPIERLLQVAMILEDVPGSTVESGRGLYEAVRRACPFLVFTDKMVFWEPGVIDPRMPSWVEPVPWDSAQVGKWTAARAVGHGLGMDDQTADPRPGTTVLPGWHLPAGSNVHRAGRTDDAHLLPDGDVVRRVRVRVATRTGQAQQTVPGTRATGLNLRALARLGHLLRINPPPP